MGDGLICVIYYVEDRKIAQIRPSPILPLAACAAFCKESRMKFANATKFDRKSGVA
jgi:hypothetical protein